MNITAITGRLCEEPEIKRTGTNKAVMNFTLAVKRPYTKDITDFINCVVWEQTAEHLGKYAHKGDRIAVAGKLITRKYQDKDGNTRTVFEVQCDTAEIQESRRDTTSERVTTQEQNAWEEYSSSEELPF